jgi:CBS domain-containing protein
MKRGVTSLVVVDADGKPQGLITERDLVRKVCVNDKPVSAVTNKEIMSSSPLITIKASSSVSKAADMMLQYNVRHLLNIDNADKPLGIISPSFCSARYLYMCSYWQSHLTVMSSSDSCAVVVSSII